MNNPATVTGTLPPPARAVMHTRRHQGLEILQANINNSRRAHDMAIAAARRRHAQVLIISEPSASTGGGRWFESTDRRAVIIVTDTELPAKQLTAGVGFVTVKIGDTEVTSCYFSPNIPITEFRNQLRVVTDTTIRRRSRRNLGEANGPMIIAGDLNAWSERWGSAKTNSRGRAVEEMLMDTGATVCNRGTTPTLERGTATSIVDVTLATAGLAARISDTWMVSPEESLSDHRHITYNTGGKTDKRVNIRAPNGPGGWAIKKMDTAIFVAALENSARASQGTTPDEAAGRETPPTASGEADTLTDRITRACDAAAPKRRYPDKYRPVYWWNNAVDQARRECNKARRNIQRAKRRRAPLTRESLAAADEQCKKARKHLRTEIRKSKEQAWKKLIAEVETDPWGTPYKICMQKLSMRAKLHPEETRSAVKKLFPPGELVPRRYPDDNQEARTALTQATTGTAAPPPPPTTRTEIAQAMKKMKGGKAPGEDNIPNEVIKMAHGTDPEAFKRMYDACITERTFPDRWKKAKLVLLPKGKPGEDGLQSYRPLCLLDGLAKGLERLIARRIEAHLATAEVGISARQFGFRRGVSTIDAIEALENTIRPQLNGKGICAAVSLDIKNAFNTASWPKIIQAMERRKVPEYLIAMTASYLSERTLVFTTAEGAEEVEVTRGVPQGSVLGPLLWNIMFDDLLRLDMPEGTEVLCYADDTIVIATGLALEAVRDRTTLATEKIISWIESAGLEVALHKTEAVLFSKQRYNQKPELRIKNQTIKWKDAMKYLGVILDKGLTYGPHIRQAAEKTRKITAQLAQLMPNLGGPRQQRKKLLMSVATSVALYGAPIWHRAMEKRTHANTMDSVHRQAVIRTISAYRTISKEAACVIAGSPPISLIAQERHRIRQSEKEAEQPPTPKRKREIRSRERETTIEEWQKQWDESANGEWTRRLISSVKEWALRKHGKITFHLTQAMSGHGCFNHYLHRFKKRADSRCDFCENPQDDVHHTIFVCDAWRELRENGLKDESGRQLTAETLTSEMLRSKNHWKRIVTAIETTLRKKEEKERELQAMKERTEPVPEPEHEQ